MAYGFSGGDVPKAPGPIKFTGRYLVLGRETNDARLPKLLRDKSGLRIATSSDFPRGTVDVSRFGGADGVYLEKVGVAVTTSRPEQLAPLTASGTGDVLVVERERIVYLFQMPRPHEAARGLPAHAGEIVALGAELPICSLVAPGTLGTMAVDESAQAWGLVATRVVDSTRTGRGVRVAVLDTGFDLMHPDFAGRMLITHSFVDGQTVQDGNQHGTHCIGTSCGASRPRELPRYGIASGADIYAGKVLDNSGSGSDGSILAGINWALTNGCRVISMSLGGATEPGQEYSQVYETVAQRALAQGTLIVAAAGNESDRANGIIKPVGHPANCPSILAVGAVDSDMQIATFSTRGFGTNGDGVDIAGPGVDIYSSVPMPKGHARLSGTSMATPHVAGIAALYAEANPRAGGRDLWQLLVTNAKALPLDAADVGAGLVQAPR